MSADEGAGFVRAGSQSDARLLMHCREEVKNESPKPATPQTCSKEGGGGWSLVAGGGAGWGEGLYC